MIYSLKGVLAFRLLAKPDMKSGEESGLEVNCQQLSLSEWFFSVLFSIGEEKKKSEVHLDTKHDKYWQKNTLKFKACKQSSWGSAEPLNSKMILLKAHCTLHTRASTQLLKTQTYPKFWKLVRHIKQKKEGKRAHRLRLQEFDIHFLKVTDPNT